MQNQLQVSQLIQGVLELHQKKVGDLLMNTSNKFRQEQTPEQLAQRIEGSLYWQEVADKVQTEFAQKHPENFKLVTPLRSQQEVADRILRASDNDPRNVSPDLKGEVIRKEIEEAEKQNLKARTQATEVIENRIQNQLKSMSIDPSSYIYSKEIIYQEEGEDN